MAQRIETEATIIDVKDDASWKYSIEADIPAFDGDRSYRYIVWKKDQGPPPQSGSTVMGIFTAHKRSKYYIDRGDIEDGPIDGSEKDYQVAWNMIGSNALGAQNGAAPSSSPGKPPNVAPTRSSDVSATPGMVYRPAPTPEDRQAEGLAKFRREVEGVNDRKAVSDILAMVEPGTYTLDGLIADAETLAGWYNARLAARCESPLVQAGQEEGAVLTKGSEKRPNFGTWIKNRAALGEGVAGQGWSKADITRVVNDAGYADSNAYLGDLGNTVQSLAELLYEALWGE